MLLPRIPLPLVASTKIPPPQPLLEMNYWSYNGGQNRMKQKRASSELECTVCNQHMILAWQLYNIIELCGSHELLGENFKSHENLMVERLRSKPPTKSVKEWVRIGRGRASKLESIWVFICHKLVEDDHTWTKTCLDGGQLCTSPFNTNTMSGCLAACFPEMAQWRMTRH